MKNALTHRALVGAVSLATCTAFAVAGDSAIGAGAPGASAAAEITIASVGAEPGSTVRMQVSLTTADVVGAFDFTFDAEGHMVDDIDYNGLLFSNGWTGWDNAPSAATFVSAACIFPQDQVSGVDLPLIELVVDVPVDAQPGDEIDVTFDDILVTDYTFVPYEVTINPGKIVITSNACDEDVTEDGIVNFADLLTVVSGWGACEGACIADVDNSGVVDLNDLLTVLASWGPCDG